MTICTMRQLKNYLEAFIPCKPKDQAINDYTEELLAAMPDNPYATRRCTATCVVEIPGPVDSVDEARKAVEAKFPGAGIYLIEAMGEERVFAFIQVSAVVGVLDRDEAKTSIINVAKLALPSLKGEWWTAQVPE